MLDLPHLSVTYGKIRVLRNVSLHVNRGEIVALIGGNGAGKSSLLNTISGLNRQHKISGKIWYAGRLLTSLDPAAIVRLGVVQVPEGRQLFAPFTVRENLNLGAYTRQQRHQRRAVRASLEKCLDLFPRLADRLDQEAGTLSGGEQQMLAIARALMADPQVLLLDEPSLGLAPRLVGEILRTISNLRRDGKTILLVEQNSRAALKIADRAYVLSLGKIALAGRAAELLTDARIRKLFLGGAGEGDSPAGQDRRIDN